MKAPTTQAAETEAKRILDTNPQLDRARIAELEAFQSHIEALGIDLRPSFQVEPPMGTVAALVPAKRR